MYTVLYSNDPYLLARMAVDLMGEGYDGDTFWNKDHHPFNGRSFLSVYRNQNLLVFHCLSNKPRITLTESNYIETLGMLIENKSKKQ